jgi:hypothetical protein
MDLSKYALNVRVGSSACQSGGDLRNIRGVRLGDEQKERCNEIAELRPKGFEIVCHLQQRVAAPTMTAAGRIGPRRAKASGHSGGGQLSFP